MDTNRAANLLLITTCVVVAVSGDGTTRTVAAVAAAVSALAGLLHEMRVRRT